MAEIRQNEFDGDPGGNGQIVETGKAMLEKIVQHLLIYKKYFVISLLFA